MTETDGLEIDVERIVRSRAGRWGKLVPGCVVGWLRRLLHEDFCNEYLRRGREGVDFCHGGVDYLGATVKVVGRENFPHDGRCYTFVSNHPLGALDGVTLGWIIGEEYGGKVKYLVNDLLMNLKGLAPLCVPINKLGSQARNLPAMVESAFGGDDHVILFPAGLCSRRQQDGQIRDVEWGKTFVTKSVKHGRDVVPIFFEGRNSERFYRVAYWCKRLRLPNLAMMLLPDEMMHCRGQEYAVHIGKPIPWQTFDRSRTPVQWAQWVKGKVYEMDEPNDNDNENDNVK